MAKKIVKKTVKKAAAKSAKKSSVKKRTTSISRAGVKKAPAKKKVKKVTEKDKQLKQANLIENSEKKSKSKRPKKVATSDETSSFLDAIVDGMHEKKAKNVTIVNLTGVENRICDFFVICDADSKTHVEAIADSVQDVVRKKTNEKPFHAEGYENAEWILIDYINIVAHVFQKEIRDYYNLEALWADAEITIA